MPGNSAAVPTPTSIPKFIYERLAIHDITPKSPSIALLKHGVIYEYEDWVKKEADQS
ncbi:hypothetical protein JR316_0012668 [Psilocybe cubensis]|uniref:Uncharacterized protein n=1 Tax=Psilocybe cubensis TaxID=181762 RepID=A0ACB8GIV2_PSICU|nr:hypothetical protein JR316_0012668 [Psilocybe cubensis]KAH9475553.1 hypothetical protein JR316_0012668 [Psilocybe cubensis]